MTMPYSSFSPEALPEDVVRAAQEKGWPQGLLQRALELRVPQGTIRRWLASPWNDVKYVERRLEWHERFTLGSLRGREATLADNEAFADLWANAPEEIGDWEIITERGPNAFAQFRLQENVNILVIEERGLLIASCAFATRSVLAGGRRIPVRYGQALRVRKEYRRQGYGDQVRSISWGAGAARPSAVQYDIMRSQNFAVVNWWEKYVPGFFEHNPKREGEVPGIPITVLQYPAQRPGGSMAEARPASEADLGRCVELINRTHDGLDLFWPYSEDFLRRRLDDGRLGEMPPDWDWPRVYGWTDYLVVEAEGRIVACGGLWDRGRDMRDRWRHVEGTEEKTIAVTALLDFGYEPGQETAMAGLIRQFVGETARLGRDYLLAPLDHLPALGAELEDIEPVPETRSLRWGATDPQITRPYTDLAYW